MLILVSFVLGAVTGVAMWFTSIQVSPRTIGLMVDEFRDKRAKRAAVPDVLNRRNLRIFNDFKCSPPIRTRCTRSASQAEGREFESLQSLHFKPGRPRTSVQNVTGRGGGWKQRAHVWKVVNA